MFSYTCSATQLPQSWVRAERPCFPVSPFDAASIHITFPSDVGSWPVIPLSPRKAAEVSSRSIRKGLAGNTAGGRIKTDFSQSRGNDRKHIKLFGSVHYCQCSFCLFAYLLVYFVCTGVWGTSVQHLCAIPLKTKEGWWIPYWSPGTRVQRVVHHHVVAGFQAQGLWTKSQYS